MRALVPRLALLYDESMSFIDEAAREINVKVVWYGAVPGAAAALVRMIAARTRPDLKREQVLALNSGLSAVHLQFVPAMPAIRGYTTRFHLYAVASESGSLESDEDRLLIFRGADACVLVGGGHEAAAIGRVDAVFAAQGYTNIPIVFAVEAADAIARGRALGFPDDDTFALDMTSGGGVFDAFKAIAKKILVTLAGGATTSRPTPAHGTVPLTTVPTQPRLAKTLEETQQGLDAWQRDFHARAIWVLGLEVNQLNPNDVPQDVPAHRIHVIRPTSSDGFVMISNGLSRDRISRLELRADCAQPGWQIAVAVSFLGRIAHRQVRAGGPPWCAFDVVTTSEEPLFGLSHFVLAPAGTVHVGNEVVTILRAVPITTDEHREVSTRQLTGDHMAAWLTERSTTLRQRWDSTLVHERPFGAPTS